MTIDHVYPVVLDVGSSRLRIGLGGEEAPREVTASIVGSSRHQGLPETLLGSPLGIFAGREAWKNRGLLNLTFPIQRGRVTDWNKLMVLLQYVFYADMAYCPEQHPLLIAGHPLEKLESRERWAEMLFENFGAPALSFANSNSLTVFSTGRTSGLVLESGAEKTSIGPVWEGHSLLHQTYVLDHGGNDLRDKLITSLRKNGYPFSTDSDTMLAERMKNSICYVSSNVGNDLSLCRETTQFESYTVLPDGSEIRLSEERFLIPEELFGLNKPKDSWSRLLFDVASSCSNVLVPEMLANIVLGGGNTLFPGLKERIERDISLFSNTSNVISCCDSDFRQEAVWIGGSILASMKTFPFVWITKAEYQEYGVSIIHRKVI